MVDSRHQIRVLNGLIETTLDSVDGYRLAAQEAPSRRLRAAFEARMKERQQVVHRLRERVRQLGGEPEDDGSILASAHRVFMCMRDRVDEDAILAEVYHGESYLAGKWQAALSDGKLADDNRQLLADCYVSIQRGHEELKRANLASPGAGSSAGEVFEAAGDLAGSSRPI